jgi:hypothetical protein
MTPQASEAAPNGTTKASPTDRVDLRRFIEHTSTGKKPL